MICGDYNKEEETDLTVDKDMSCSSLSPKPLPNSTDSVRRSLSLNKTLGSGLGLGYFHDAYLASVPDPSLASTTSAHIAYSVELRTDLNTGGINCSEPRAYAAKFKTHNEDNPSYQMAMTSERAHEWEKAMIIEIKGIIKQNTWKPVDRLSVPKGKVVLPGTWSFKLKRLPDGSPSKYKAR